MKLKSEFMIDGNVVELVASFAGISVYEYSTPDADEFIHYFVNNSNEVITTHKFEADYGQGVGYISSSKWVVV